MRILRALVVFLCAPLCIPAIVSAVPLYNDDFTVDSSASWNINKAVINSSNVSVPLSPSDPSSSAEFAWDYSAMGIPSAPHTLDGSTKGLRLRSNLGAVSSVNGTTQRTCAITVAPTGQSFTGSYVVQYDLWSNYIGGTSLNPSGSNATECVNSGIGASGTKAQYSFDPAGALMFANVHDGGTTNTDYRIYPAAANLAASSGFYKAGTAAANLDNTDPYYAFLGTHMAPAYQQTTYPSSQTGTTPAGTTAFAWHTVTIGNDGTTVTWSIDGVALAMIPVSSAGTWAGTDIFLGSFDTNNGSSSGNGIDLNFDVFDNLTVVPEPASIAILGLLSAGLLFRRR